MSNQDSSLRLDRFLDAQADVYDTALNELRSGQKHSHWMWYIFPQVAGLGSSSTARFYAIHSRQEAEAYLAHPVLGARLRQCTETLLQVEGKSARQIMGSPDDLKLKSSMTLFAQLAGQDSPFQKVIARYFNGQTCQHTIDFLND